MEYFLQQLINGLTLGMIYGLIAIGYTMVYGIVGMINFAHGEIYMIGKDLQLAQKSFQKVIDNTPQHAKAPDAMFKIATIYLETDKKSKAKKTLEQIQDKYPKSTAANLAKNRLTIL